MSRPHSAFSSGPAPSDSPLASRGYSSNTTDFAHGNPTLSSPLAQSMSTAPIHSPTTYTDPSSAGDDGPAGLVRATSTASTAVQASAPARSNTLRKKASMRRADSLKRSGSKRSLKAGSIAGFGGVDRNQEYTSFSTTPIPTQGSPTEILANRFQAWRQLLKSLITYFREIQASYEVRVKAAHKVQSIIASINTPSLLTSEHGLNDATHILDDYHKRTAAEANKSREIEEDVIGALTGLRSDLGQKIKEIKSLSGDFKNSVEKEKDATRREVEKFQESISMAERDDGGAVGKADPYVVKLGVDRAIERQIDEENYLHRAYLNLESSGRELESIVVGEIQKAYNALASILKREGDDAYNVVDSLRSGPISLPKDVEWQSFVERDPHFVDPNVPLRRVEDIDYPGKHHPSAVEVRAGMLERKSKYLKSYTPGWYVLSPTHLHEFKSADKIYSQPPVMSLYLPDQKLGSRSQPGSTSYKFLIKGKQSGTMHKGHNWVFRAESYDTMLAWFEDMSILTEKTGEERNAFVRKHARSYSSASRRASMSSDGMEEDEADRVPYSADVTSLSAAAGTSPQDARPPRPQPGGRFPSDLQIPRARGASEGQWSNESSEPGNGAAAGAALAVPLAARYEHDPYRLEGVTAGTATVNTYNWEEDERRASYFGGGGAAYSGAYSGHEAPGHQQLSQSAFAHDPAPVHHTAIPDVEHSTVYSDWVAPAAIAGGLTGGTVGVAAAEHHHHSNHDAQHAAPSSSEAAPPVVAAAAVHEDRHPLTKLRSPSETEIRGGVDAPDAAPATPPVVAANTYGHDSTALPVASAVPAGTAASSGELGGLEARGAQETGSLPTVVRHDTSVSVSQLHVPGEFK